MPDPAGPSERLVATPHGDAKVISWTAAEPRLTLLLQHGANGKLDSRDLVTLVSTMPGDSVNVLLLQQPFALAGKRIAPRPAALDQALEVVVPELDAGLPLVLGGRSAGARSSARCAGRLGAVGCLALAFPLHPPGRPDKSRADELLEVGVPTLVLQGDRDPFGAPEEFPPLPATTRLVAVPGADHGFAVLKRGEVTQEETLAQIVRETGAWLAGVVS